MIGLKSSRVVVIDDNPLEAIPLLYELGKLGVSALYIRGNRIEDLPTKPLRGARLVFLDLQLDVSGEYTAIVANAVNVLERTIGKTRQSPTVVVVWTKHLDMFAEFVSRTTASLPSTSPECILRLAKPFDFESWELPKDVWSRVGVLSCVNKVVRRRPPLELLWACEQAVHDAAADTTDSIAALSKPLTGACTAGPVGAGGGWSKMGQILGSLVYAHAGKGVKSGRQAVDALLRSLVPMITEFGADAQLSVVASKDSARRLAQLSIKEAAERAKQKPRLSLSEMERAKLNRLLMLTCLSTRSSSAAVSGSLHTVATWNSLSGPFPISAKHISKAALVKDVIHLKSSDRAKVSQACNVCRPFVLEITPPCDVVQAKAPLVRLVAGVAIPASSGFVPKPRSAFAHALPLIELQAQDGFGSSGATTLVLDFRFTFGLALDEIARQHPRIRLNSAVLADVLSKGAAYAARCGCISV